MAKVVIYWWGLDIFLCGKIFVHVYLQWGFHIILFTFQKLTHTCMCYVCNLDWHFICAPMPCPRSPHQIHIWKRGFYYALHLKWMWFGPRLGHSLLECLKNDKGIVVYQYFKIPQHLKTFPQTFPSIHTNCIISVSRS